MLPQFPEATANDCLVADERMDALTRKWITPNMGLITIGLRKIRARVDAHFEAQKAAATKQKAGYLSEMKDITRYPYGYCDIIRNIVWDHIHKSVAGQGPYVRYFAALKPFLRNGGLFRKIWGELTYGPYFQSAMQLGAYYIDVSNDTVVITKPKLEIKFLKDTQIVNVDDFEQYFTAAQSYFKWDVYPNVYLPEFASLYPGVAIHRNTGALLLCGVAKPVFYKNLNSGGHLAAGFVGGSSYAGRRLPGEQEASMAAFREEVLPQLLERAQRENAALGRELELAADYKRLRAWLEEGHKPDAYRATALRLETIANKVGSVLRPYSLRQLAA